MLDRLSILERVINPAQGDFTAELARQILGFDFPQADHERYAELSAKASEGQLSGEERCELEEYLNVNDFLMVIKAKAHVRWPVRRRPHEALWTGTSSRAVRERANHRCEYCHLPESASIVRHVVDHIIARQHGGLTTFDNLALAGGRCNLSKGPNLSGLDPDTLLLTRLFNPRTDDWARHFQWDDAILLGTTPVGRTTVYVLAINLPLRIDTRRRLVGYGRF